MTNIHDFSVNTQEGSKISLNDYKGKVLLVVNTATKCGFTKQYEDLENLYQEIGNDDFDILDFPCNQFAEQAPGTSEDINQFCALNYGTTFPRFEKIEVNGADADPLYQWLRKQQSEDEGAEAKSFAEKIEPMNNFTEDDAINWNFTKFLIDANGQVLHRYSPTVEPKDIKDEILNLIHR